MDFELLDSHEAMVAKMIVIKEWMLSMLLLDVWYVSVTPQNFLRIFLRYAVCLSSMKYFTSN